MDFVVVKLVLVVKMVLHIIVRSRGESRMFSTVLPLKK